MPAFQMLKKISNFPNRNCKFAHFKNSTMRNILLVAILFISSLSFSQEKYNALATPNTYQNADNPNYWKNKIDAVIYNFYYYVWYNIYKYYK